MALGTRTSTRRDRVLRAYVRRELYPHTEGAREQLQAARLGRDGVRTIADLHRVPPVSLDEVGDGSRHVVRPTRRDLLRSGAPAMRARTAWASTWGRWGSFLRVIEPTYRPVHFFTADGVPVGAAAADLIRLAGFGSVWVRSLGIGATDSVALVGGAGAGIEAWQLSGGTRRAGVSLAVVDDASSAARHATTVVAGPPKAVIAALANGAWPELRLVIVFGPSSEAVPRRLAQLNVADRVALRRAWAPPGTRSVWFECAGGAVRGWHTLASADLVEIDADGEALWTGLGWAGTVFLRLRTGALAEALDDSPCPDCGQTAPRVFLSAGDPALGRWLRADPRVLDVRLTDAGADILPTRAGRERAARRRREEVVPRRRGVGGGEAGLVGMRAPVYLDHAATSPMRPEAVAAMLPLLGEQFGNPSGSHAMARAARDAIEDARDEVAGALGCDAGDVVFTGSGTEADNLAVTGVGDGRRICSAVEHHAVLRCVERAGGATVPVDGDGRVDVDALVGMLDDKVALVSVMLANNETGVLQPLDEVVEAVRRHAPARWCTPMRWRRSTASTWPRRPATPI